MAHYTRQGPEWKKNLTRRSGEKIVLDTDATGKNCCAIEDK